jgi:hypothetical protein
MKLRLQRRQILALGAALGAAWACGEVAVSPGPAIPQKGLKPARNLRALVNKPQSVALTSTDLILHAFPKSIVRIPRDGGPLQEVSSTSPLSLVLARGRIVFCATIGAGHYAVDSVEVDGGGLKRLWEVKTEGRPPEMSGNAGRVAWTDPNSAIWALDGERVVQLSAGPAQNIYATNLGVVWTPRSNDLDLQREYRITSWDGVETLLGSSPTSPGPVVAVADVLLAPLEDAFFRLRPGGLDRYMAYAPGIGFPSAFATDGKTLVFAREIARKDPQVNQGTSVGMVNPFRPNDPPTHIFDTKAGLSEIAYDDRGMAWIEVTYNQEKTPSYTLMVADFA